LVGESVSFVGPQDSGRPRRAGLCPVACYVIDGGLVPVWDAECSIGFNYSWLEKGDLR
jgi:hypothetical protein